MEEQAAQTSGQTAWIACRHVGPPNEAHALGASPRAHALMLSTAPEALGVASSKQPCQHGSIWASCASPSKVAPHFVKQSKLGMQLVVPVPRPTADTTP